jgi:Flp pilus assembly pilin Flp
MNYFFAMLKDDRGATMTEYAIIVSLLTAATMGVLIGISNTANSSLSNVANATQNYQVSTPP